MVNTLAHQQMALEVAVKGIVMLKNTNNTLPLAAAGTVAVVGPNAEATTTMQGTILNY